MASSTVELVALWASSSPSLLAFCFSHLIIAVLLLGGRGCAQPDVSGGGEWTSGAAGAEALDGTQMPGEKMSSGGQDSPTTPTVAVSVVHGRVAEVDMVDAVQVEASETSNGAEEGTVAADYDMAQEKCDNEEEDDELMMRAEEFIQRMNRVWRAENLRPC
ncbi:hypothetical protein HU200_025225 [Digitaria exilis]|uniref:Uncharacterized protein n=1 Tax=Digitaria exilis TaxID=1010633 RepID=A0A835EVS5_9POAL|nr:hypothetical protein HU200_025225 [Digitaria exilis]